MCAATRRSTTVIRSTPSTLDELDQAAPGGAPESLSRSNSPASSRRGRPVTCGCGPAPPPRAAAAHAGAGPRGQALMSSQEPDHAAQRAESSAASSPVMGGAVCSGWRTRSTATARPEQQPVDVATPERSRWGIMPARRLCLPCARSSVAPRVIWCSSRASSPRGAGGGSPGHRLAPRPGAPRAARPRCGSTAACGGVKSRPLETPVCFADASRLSARRRAGGAPGSPRRHGTSPGQPRPPGVPEEAAEATTAYLPGR